MRTRQSKADKALDKEIEAAYYRVAQGVQVNIMDIPKIFWDAREQLIAGVPLDQSMPVIVERYRSKS